MQDTRTYVALTGMQAAFGWIKRGANGTLRAVFGGLLPHTEYETHDHQTFTTDDLGGWSGELTGEMPLYAARKSDGRVALYDENKITVEEATIMARPRAGKVPERVTAIVIEKPEEQTLYRTRLGGESVDALPALFWPPEAQNLQPYFEKYKPVRLLDEPLWRFVQVENPDRRCYVGYRAADDRVCELAWAVEARGALTPPKGLAGYRYTRCADGSACWLFKKSV